MFDNRFNSKNVDPLVEAVKAAQADGDMRRQAVAHVNEAFGVYNRNAVVREHLAAYDAAIEEAYQCMKEGKPLSPKQQKMASLAGDPKKIDAADLASLRKGAKIDEKKGCMYEGKPNDGNLANNYPPYDKVTRGDVIAGRLGKDQMGGKKKVNEKKMWEGSGVSGEDPGMEVAKQAGARQQQQTPSSTPARTGNAAGATISKAKEAINEAVSRKHFQQVADLIKGHESQEKRNELASHHAGIFAKQNPRFNHEKFHAAAGSTAHQAPKSVKESVIASILEKYSSFKTAQDSGKSVNEVAVGMPPQVNPPAIHGSMKAGVQKATQAAQKIGARFAPTGFRQAAMSAAPTSVGSSFTNMASNATKAATTGLKAGLGRIAGSLGGPAGIAASIAAPYAAKAMSQSHQQGHASFVQHPTTPGVKTSDVFARMRQMKPTETDKAQAPKPAEPSSFKAAFAAARKEAGSGQGQFTYKGKQFQTNLNPAKGAEKYIPASQQKVTSVGKSAPASTTASTSTSTTPGSMSVSSQPAPPSSATASMSSAANKVGISQTPTGIKTDFGAGKSLAPLPTSSTSKAASAPTPAPTPQNPDQDKTKIQAPLPSMSQPGGGASNDASSGMAKMNAMPKAPEPAATGSVKFKDSSVSTPKTVAESFVNVGTNKYRIV